MQAILVDDTSVGWTEITKDAVGRLSRVERFQSKFLPNSPSHWPNWAGAPDQSPNEPVSLGVANYTYDNNKVTFQDEEVASQGGTSGLIRETSYDAQGRVISVSETGLPTTEYKYNARDQLARVGQGSQVRKFKYSSLSRLVQSEQPEGGATASAVTKYSYGAAGNLTKREEERAPGLWTTTSWAPHDALNRPTSKSYQGGTTATAAVTYEYDRGGFKGALSGVSTADATLAYRYDKLGRVRNKTQVTSFATATAATNRVAHVLAFEYDLADNLSKMTLPSGRVVTYTRDAVGRLQSCNTRRGRGRGRPIMEAGHRNLAATTREDG